MSYVEGTVGLELGSVPFGSMIKDIALGIAEGQWALDKSSMVVAELMSGHRLLRDLDTGKLIGADGQELKNGDKLQFIDSRIYFGYNIEEVPESSGSTKKILKRTPRTVSMMELGFAPNFYQFVETIIEIKIVVSMRESESSYKPLTEKVVTAGTTTVSQSSSTTGWWRHNYNTQIRQSTLTTRSVDPALATKYDYSVEGSAFVRTKLVPIPPPAILEERIREVMAQDKEFLERIMDPNVSAET